MEFLEPKEEMSVTAFSEFTQDEISEMEVLFKEVGEESINQQFCQKLATSFSSSSSHDGKHIIQWEQVQNWFKYKQKGALADIASMAIVPMASDEDTTISSNYESSQFTKGINTSSLSELAFEALSARDNAWYDVASFLNYRYLCSGELEVRIRFSGFGNDNDEWVNVERGVRERSIPLEATECYKVKIGDMVLCFQERQDQAVYCDARVFEIQRRIHDTKGCRCTFFVRYDHDHTEANIRILRGPCSSKMGLMRIISGPFTRANDNQSAD